MPDPLTNLRPDQAIKVLPRHLAGPGTADLRTIWPFPFDEDWTLHQTDEGGPAVAASPCLSLRMGNVSTPTPGRQWITAGYREPFGPAAWQISFDTTTPVELLHDVHAELLDRYLEDRHRYPTYLFRGQTPPAQAYVPLLARGWSHTVKTDGTQTFLAPDGFGGVQHMYAAEDGPSSSPAWKA